MAEYKQVKIGKLRLKGASSSGVKKNKTRKRKHDKSEATENTQITKDEDALNHGGWWRIKEYSKLQSCNVALQTYKESYVIANDNGTLSLGDLNDSHVPQVEEIFTLVVLTETKVAFKSGYGKFVDCCNQFNQLTRLAKYLKFSQNFCLQIKA